MLFKKKNCITKANLLPHRPVTRQVVKSPCKIPLALSNVSSANSYKTLNIPLTPKTVEKHLF